MNRLYVIPAVAAAFTVGVLVGLPRPVPAIQPAGAVRTVEGDDYPSIWKEPATSSMIDSWGNGNRQCTSWVSWKLWQQDKLSTYGWGNAKEWPQSATAHGLQVSYEPAVHAVAVDTSFMPGHVMWVEQINDDGTILVSEYNYSPGKYSERNVASKDLTYIIPSVR